MGLFTHSFRWESGRAAFKSVRQSGTPNSPAVAERLFAAQVPTAGAENVHVSLLYDRSAPRPPSKDVEMVVERFAFLP